MKYLSIFALFVALFSSAQGQYRGTVRLVKNGVSLSNFSSGIVQIYYGPSGSYMTSWGNICDDSSFDYNEANVICNQLGYDGVSTYGRAGNTTSYGTDAAATIVDDVDCFSSSYLTLQQCSLSTDIKSSCISDSEDVYVSCYTTRIWENPYPGQIRLQGGTYTSFGRLEVYCNGQWGTVCDDSFDATDARAACRQLGYSDYTPYVSGNFAGPSSQPIWLNNVTCSSTSNCLATCESCPATQYHNCGHNRDVVLGCEFDDFYIFSSNTLRTCQYATLPDRGTVRLIRNGVFLSTYSSGIVQIYYGSSSSTASRWGNICYDTSFASTEANVICNQLGYNGVSTYGGAGSTTSYGTDAAATILDDVNCASSSYLTLQQCSLSTVIKSSCVSNSEDVYVSCYTTRIWNNPYPGQIRLQGGNYSSYGRLEVYCNGQWGTVCDDTFGPTDARVACRQLGYSDYDSYFTDNILAGSSSQPIWLDNVFCFSSYNCLANCQMCPSSQSSRCEHSQDVIIRCRYGYGTASSNTLSTCQYADSRIDIGAIIGGVIAAFVICCVLIISIPICICCCLGVGIEAATRGGNKTKNVVTGAATMDTKTEVVTVSNA
ncbi:PREDICTED: deleted in malignant brain tumors 1 protein-like isoform X2 [Amphimedon queenslandica]|uniref:SRCR domain-containing protein n=1 Tax=Amphimedon queenslandica TaxID=400682 RepID=A0AAN0IXK2_AMPQE|nr:PREDICTED: deleted in malignant brain tumors 1 protein-like isoform X2 [Amphimedon queenslandica]|eukprot:XP_019849178.1 PREDICTED: deleted in malignant brain tumors 1 protein-like isoform X2 [Amphimedon queenslandica]